MQSVPAARTGPAIWYLPKPVLSKARHSQVFLTRVADKLMCGVGPAAGSGAQPVVTCQQHHRGQTDLRPRMDGKLKWYKSLLQYGKWKLRNASANTTATCRQSPSGKISPMIAAAVHGLLCRCAIPVSRITASQDYRKTSLIKGFDAAFLNARNSARHQR